MKKERTYHPVGDYLLPALDAPEPPSIGKYGTMRHRYLQNHHRGIYDGMLLAGTLNDHLEEIDRQANDMTELLTVQLAKNEGVTEQLKTRDQMEWIRRMNGIRNRAEEIVIHDLIYA